MIITYTDTAHCTEIKGLYLTARYYHRKNRDTNIVWEIWRVVKENIDRPLIEMSEPVRQAYKNRKSKSRLDILYEKDYIEMTNKGVFPNIMIIKNEKAQP